MYVKQKGGPPVNSFDNYPLTWKPDKDTCKPPYYLSLADDLEQTIRNGLLEAGTKLPPQREIADYLDLDYTTITRVYNICKKKGLIYGITGSGTFVAPHSRSDITITGNNITESCIELGMISSFCEYAPYVGDAIATIINKGALPSLLRYDHPIGMPHQLASASRWMEQFGVHSDISHIAILPGAQNAIAVSMMSFFEGGDSIAVDSFTYSNVIGLAKILNLKLIPVPGDSHGMKPEELEKLCKRNKIKGIFLMPGGSNPCNIFIPEQRRYELATVIQRYTLTLIEDDAVSWLRVVEGRKPIPSMFDLLENNCVHISGAAKNICPGLRIAFVAFRDNMKDRFLHGQFNINVKASSLDAEIINELIVSGNAFRTLRHKYQMTRKACDVFNRIFPEFKDTKPSYHKWIPIRTDKTYQDVEQELILEGVRTFLSERFAVADQQEQFLRISLASAGNMPRLAKGLGILRNYIDKHSMLQK